MIFKNNFVSGKVEASDTLLFVFLLSCIGEAAEHSLLSKLLLRPVPGQAHFSERLEHPGPSLGLLLHGEWRHRHHQQPLASHDRPPGTGHQVDQEHGEEQCEMIMRWAGLIIKG